MTKRVSKEDRFSKVAWATFSILNQSGAGAVSHSRVARLAKVSRSWLYKYVGKTQKSLLDFASIHFGNQMAEGGTSAQKSQAPEEFITAALQATWQLLDRFQNNPEILSLYFKYAGTSTLVGGQIAELEKRQFFLLGSAVSKNFKISPAEGKLVAEIIMAIRMGLCFRFTQVKMGERHSVKEIQKAMRRVFQHSTVELKKLGN